MWKWHKCSISEAQGRQLMHTESSACLFISPLISVVLLLMSPGSRWHCKPFNHRLIHRRTFTHISHSKASRPITDSAPIIFPDTVLIRRYSLKLGSLSLLAIGLTGCVCNHFLNRTGAFCTHWPPDGVWGYYVGLGHAFPAMVLQTGGQLLISV